MLARGTITLLQFDEVIRQVNYQGAQHRKRITEMWRHELGPRFISCEISILPDDSQALETNPDGTSFRDCMGHNYYTNLNSARLSAGY